MFRQNLLKSIILPKIAKDINRKAFSIQQKALEKCWEFEFESSKLKRVLECRDELELNFFKHLETTDEVTFYQEYPLKLTYTYKEKKYDLIPSVLFYLK